MAAVKCACMQQCKAQEHTFSSLSVGDQLLTVTQKVS